MTTSPYTHAGILWHGYILSVKYNAPLSMQSRLLAAAEDAEEKERSMPRVNLSAWPDKPCGEQRTASRRPLRI